MKRFCFFALCALATVMVLLSSTLAQHDGVIQDEVCRQVQKDAQAAVQAGEPFRNHGQRQRAAAHVVDAAERAGLIDAVCSSCILNQFARNVPIEEQVPCGPDGGPCEAGDCDNQNPCAPADSGTCVDPICAETAEGDIVCIEGLTPCNLLTDCNGTSDCPAGWRCVTTLCCNRAVCLPPEAFCDYDGS